ncbi:MAG TPA: response regulator transcription factor [Gemmatimonadaceae bacterium]|nr:response regulator transcription factor [Gemmatimonadaceae bacterium]
MRALVVEDDETVARLNKRLLELEGLEVDLGRTVKEGTQLAAANAYDIIMLDMGLPDGSGLSVLEVIRSHASRTPVLIVSGTDDVASTVAALDAGADDYLNKPYDESALRARVRAVMRRGQPVSAHTIQCGNIVIHRLERSATVGGTPLRLTAKEFALLEYFIMHREKTVARKELLHEVWRFDFDPGTNLVDVNVGRLRGKLIDLDATCRIETQRGIGYTLSEPGTVSAG